ncbi:hypothetical protein [Bradyrhizobium diazoefficiens]|uniref:hypothetical protein n=1 Tax=Bradyrhizobium diazoefficiens TaxID=1355477 RepID=UPI002729EEDD|nr:hypothetical protein [Bradyrhizobium diazoefficiens]WLA62372.1 hypothetical protein QNN01_28320 [Bradyrhizobium diazoefficiens]
MSSATADEIDRADLQERIAELEKLLAMTTGLGQQLEFQRNSFIHGATARRSARDLRSRRVERRSAARRTGSFDLSAG